MTVLSRTEQYTRFWHSGTKLMDGCQSTNDWMRSERRNAMPDIADCLRFWFQLLISFLCKEPSDWIGASYRHPIRGRVTDALVLSQIRLLGRLFWTFWDLQATSRGSKLQFTVGKISQRWTLCPLLCSADSVRCFIGHQSIQLRSSLTIWRPLLPHGYGYI